MRRALIKSETHAFGGEGAFILGKAEEVSARLLETHAGKIDLIYLDPPFGTGEKFQTRLAGHAVAIPTFADDLSREDYLAMMRTVLENSHKLLASTGSLYLHIDFRMNAPLRLMLDEIFGEANFMNEIIWQYRSGGRSKKHFSRKHDVILFYRKSKASFFDLIPVGVPRGDGKRNNMKKNVDDDGRVFYSIRTNGKLYKYYEDSLVFPSDVWDDIEHLQQKDPERTGYSTQKPEALLRRMILSTSKPGDTVLDLFSGSGTAAAVAASESRRFIMGDISKLAMCTLRRRLITERLNTSMFAPDKPFTITYDEVPECDVPLSLELDVTPCENGFHASVASYSGKYGLAALIFGYVKGDAFTATSYIFAPKEGAAFEVSLDVTSCESTPAVLVCDHGGDVGCYYIDINIENSMVQQ